MEPEQQLRNLRDFLLVYNRMTEICFNRCASNLNYRSLTLEEEHCLENCAGKLIRSNHRLMNSYVSLMPAIVQRRVADFESKAVEMTQTSNPGISSSIAVGTASEATDKSEEVITATEQITSLKDSQNQDSSPATSH